MVPYPCSLITHSQTTDGTVAASPLWFYREYLFLSFLLPYYIQPLLEIGLQDVWCYNCFSHIGQINLSIPPLKLHVACGLWHVAWSLNGRAAYVCGDITQSSRVFMDGGVGHYVACSSQRLVQILLKHGPISR